MTDSIIERIKQVMEENGIDYDDKERDEVFDVDSLTYMSIIVCLEEKFQIDIPLEFLEEKLSYSSIYNMISNALSVEDKDKIC